MNAHICSEIIILLTRLPTKIDCEPKLLQKLHFLLEMKPAGRTILKIKVLLGTLKVKALVCIKIIMLLTRPRRPQTRVVFEPKILSNFLPEMKPACRAVLKIKFLLGALKVKALVSSKIIMLLKRATRNP